MYICENIVNQSRSWFRYPGRSVNPGPKFRRTKVQKHVQEIITVIICSVIEKIDIEVSKKIAWTPFITYDIQKFT